MNTPAAPAPARWRHSLRARLTLWSLGTALAAATLALLATALGAPWLVAGAAAVLGGGAASALLLNRLLGPVLSLFRALAGTVSSYGDGDFAFSVVWPHDDELRSLVQAHNHLGQVLREQRLGLVQRELLLDTMVQNTPVAMLLADSGARVVYANLAARHLLGQGQRLEGHALAGLWARLPPALAEALQSGQDGLTTVPAQAGTGLPSAEEDEVFHLTRQALVLNGQTHSLLLLRRLTQELRRQEVQTWKKLIRVISHELNNSLAPIASLAYSGRTLAERGRAVDVAALPELLSTIEERARHLDAFISGYAQFAKLPQPRLQPVSWPTLLARLQAQQPFSLHGAVPEGHAALDAAQIEQALINLLKNAHESGSPPQQVFLQLQRRPGEWWVDVLDRGPGMSDAVLAQALTPFYSTKRQGTGLGLALAREITEVHGGRLLLQRREGGGLCVSMRLPG